MKARPAWKRAATAAAVVAIVSAASTALAADPPPTTPSNLDPDSAGHGMVFLGLVNTSTVFFSSSCPLLDMGPLEQCIALAGISQPYDFKFPDLGSISIPPQSTTTIVWPVFIQNATWRLFNSTGAAATGIFRTNVIFTIESDVLKDPSLMCPDPDQIVEDPVQCNGRFVSTIPLAYGEAIPLAANERTVKRVRAGSAGIGAFDTAVFAGLNMTEKLLKKLFASPMTIRVGLSGHIQLVDPGSVSSLFVGVRLIGDR